MKEAFKSSAAVWGILIAGSVISVMLFQAVWSSHKSRASEEFERNAIEAIFEFNMSIDRDLEVLHSVRSLYQASMEVERGEFREFVSRYLSTNPSVRAIAWVHRVAGSERTTYEEGARQEGFSSFEIVEASEQGLIVAAANRDEHFPVYYVEPYIGFETTLGFDLASFPAIWDAMTVARDTDQVVVTEVLILPQETPDLGIVIGVLPIYRNGSPATSLEDRREHIEGFVLGALQPQSVIESGAFLNEAALKLQIIDRSAPTGEQMLFPARSGDESEDEAQAAMNLNWSLDVGGREWEIIVGSSRDDLSLFSW